MLAEDNASPPVLLRRLVHAFLQSECDEAAVRLALGDAAPLYRDAPEAASAREGGAAIIRTLTTEALADADEARRRRATELIEATFTQVGSHFSAVPRTADEIAAYAEEMADMFDAYLSRRAR